MVTMTDRKRQIEMIRKLPEQARAAVKGLNDEQLNTPYGEGKWTVRQVIHHLADSHMNAFVRMKLVLTEDNPTLKPYSQDDWARTKEAVAYPVESSLHILTGLHERWATLLDGVAEAGWSRTAFHPENGPMTLQRLLDIYADHGEKHVRSITDLRQRKGW
jgi:uncharacterized damage-inducible protein DinB